MKGLGLYRVLSFFVSIFSLFAALAFLLSLLALLQTFTAAFSVFICLAIVLYYWYSRKFFVDVFVMNGEFPRRLKDRLQVNAIVTIIICLIIIGQIVFVVVSPEAFKETLARAQAMLDQQAETTEKELSKLKFGLLTYLTLPAAVLAHVIWTLILLRKHLKQQKQEE